MRKKSFIVISSDCYLMLMMVVITGISAMTNSTINGTVSVVPKGVASEGGTQPQKKISTKDLPRMGREHVIDKPYMNTSSGLEILVKPDKNENSTNLASLNGIPLKPLNASHELKVVTMKMSNNNITDTKSEALNSTAKDIAINSTTVIQKMNSTLSNTTNSMLSANITKSSTAKPMKPTRTEHDDVVINEKLESHSSNIPSIDTTFEKKTKRADYVVPIVAVILSIPLVAIIFSVLLKRGKDWWQHRNYRRMDFLIEGMYNS